MGEGKSIFDLVGELIGETPGLSATIDSLPSRLNAPLEDRYTGKGLTLACLIYPEKAYICLYMAANEQMVEFQPGARIFKRTINHDSLEVFIGEFKAGLKLKGFMPTHQGRQNNRNGALIARTFAFYGLNDGFVRELTELVSSFEVKYKF